MKLSTLFLFLSLLGAQPPDRIFVNGQVLTMDAAARTTQAVAIRGGEIIVVGTNAEIRNLAIPSTVVSDLNGKTLAPGLYAAHDHFPSAGTVAVHRVDLNSPPIGRMRSIEDVVAALKTRAASAPAGTWIVGRVMTTLCLPKSGTPRAMTWIVCLPGILSGLSTPPGIWVSPTAARWRWQISPEIRRSPKVA